ncbi:Crp/Fnr family transcriptional regulator [Desulfoluna spongiiphila]|uniref:cAMP-binding domain of CRP or a regulatory subunit of cAMP-dependent protein kinases n=1 Tax=Desulfoluna spongiiphila TaxID=419481 RepID=A0A1G5BLD7_9BACT|nr:Crp/Fnr family transcriptional regulator [Desulfoluna spongiiphila]SCX90968.1 cAMP-binding domain of CRP or a regulatory subunit of cAMP-dependent protein kinases [Desulfoluna spongiiphila]
MTEKPYDFSENQKVNIMIEGMNTCWKDILHMATLHSFSKGQVVDQAADGVYLVKEGCLSYSCYLDSGEKRILYFVGRDSLCNEAGCMIHLKDRVSFEFLADTQVYTFPPHQFMDVDFVRSYPELSINLSQYIIFKRIYLSHFVANFSNNKPVTRVAEILLQLYESEHGITISQLDIANFLGLHLMTVSRALAQLRDENIIGKITKNKFEIFDPERLAEYAEW